ncbi:hypothetical protein [Sphingomonas jaspsi]|uniref:hypothetical protein n=1 Tax=Sphingomonas jaspsi TaxID=392409 RepID=UPI0004B0E51F|nr:hypothetical protein [Sphingomonas jaspsi]
MLSPLAYWILLLAVSAFALSRGSRDERLVMSIIVAASVLTVLVYSPPTERFEGMETGLFMVDVAALAGFVGVALMSSRFWPLWVAGFQLTSVMSHAMKAIHWDLIPRVYAAAERFWIYPMLLALIVGTWRAHRRNSAAELTPAT